MQLTIEQQQAIDRGEAVSMIIDGKVCVLLSQQAYEELDDMDYGTMTLEEMNLLADEANDIISRAKPMNIKRGDVINARFPHASGTRGKKRPVVVVQADVNNQRLRHAVDLQMTTNLSDQNDPACVLIEAGSPEGKAAGLTKDCLASAYLLAMMNEDRLQDIIGELSDETMEKIDECLKTALPLP